MDREISGQDAKSNQWVRWNTRWGGYTFTLARRVRTRRVRHDLVFGPDTAPTGTGQPEPDTPTASAEGARSRGGAQPSKDRPGVRRKANVHRRDLGPGGKALGGFGRRGPVQKMSTASVGDHRKDHPEGVGQLTRSGTEWRFVTSRKPREGEASVWLPRGLPRSGLPNALPRTLLVRIAKTTGEREKQAAVWLALGVHVGPSCV